MTFNQNNKRPLSDILHDDHDASNTTANSGAFRPFASAADTYNTNNTNNNNNKFAPRSGFVSLPPISDMQTDEIVIGIGSVQHVLPSSSTTMPHSSSALGGDMAKIEAEFRDLKEKYFRDQVAKLKREIDEIKAGTHAEFVSQLAELEKSRTTKLMAATAWRQFKLGNVQNEFETDKKVADDEFMEEKRQHRDRMINSVMERKKAISEEKNTMSLASDTQNSLGGTAAQRNKRTLRRRAGHEKDDGPTSGTTHTPPIVRYSVSDQEAMQDLTAIRTGTSAVLNGGAVGGGNGAGAAVDVSSIFVQADVGVARGVLRYHGSSFQVNDNVFVKADTDAAGVPGSEQTWSGSIVFVSPVEIHVQCNGNKCRFSIDNLRRGVYRLSREPQFAQQQQQQQQSHLPQLPQIQTMQSMQ